MTGTIHDRFWAKVDIRGEDECWEWLAFKNKGYGQFRVGAAKMPAHRYSLTLKLQRALSPDEMACHHCDNPGCVNPKHLYAGDARSNAADASARDRLHGGDTAGERNGGAKLTWSAVRLIRRRLAAGECHWAIAREHGVGEASIRHLAAGRTWKTKDARIGNVGTRVGTEKIGLEGPQESPYHARRWRVGR